MLINFSINWCSYFFNHHLLQLEPRPFSRAASATALMYRESENLNDQMRFL